MASTAAVAILATVIGLLVLTFLVLFMYQIFCGKSEEDDSDIEAKPRRRKTPKKDPRTEVRHEDRVDLSMSKAEKKRQKEEAKRLKKEEKEREKREMQNLKKLEKERRKLDQVEMREKQNGTSRDTVLKMASAYDSLEIDRQNRLSKISERSSKTSNQSRHSDRNSGHNFSYLAGSEDFTMATRSNRGSSFSGSGAINIDKANQRSGHAVARESSFRSERSGHSGIGSASMYSANLGTMNVGFDDNKSDVSIPTKIDEELASLRSGSSGLVRARASQWETTSQRNSSRRTYEHPFTDEEN